MLIMLATIEDEKEQSKIRKIYENYVGIMRCKAFLILKNRHDADDAVHNAFVRIIDHLESLPDPQSTQTKWYVVKAAENAAIDIWRKRKRTGEISIDESPEISNLREPYEGENKIIKEILELSEKDKEYLLLKHVYGYKNAEMGKMLNMSEDAVKKAVRRAEERLEKKCREEGLL